MYRILSAHQPDIFPYAGLFNKMKNSDYFDMAIFDEYSKGRYMDRVKMGRLGQEVWVNVPVHRKSSTQIKDILLKDNWKELFFDRIEKQYKNFKYYKERINVVRDVLDKDHKTLADIGADSIKSIANFFELECEIKMLGDNLPKGTDGIIELIKRYKDETGRDITYISGIGGKAYLDEQKISDIGANIEYSKFETKYKCSILTPIFELKTPQEIIV